MSELPELLRLTAERVADYRTSAGERPVAPPLDSAGLRDALGGPLPEQGTDPSTVIEGDGTCWMGGTTWGGRRLMRISVSNWSTTEADVDRSVASIRRVLELERSAA